MKTLMMVAAVPLALGVVTAAQGPATLTNDDIIKMVRPQLANSIIVTSIESSNAIFDVSPAGLIVVLLTGKGSGPFSGPLGATSGASELVKALKPYRLIGKP